MKSISEQVEKLGSDDVKVVYQGRQALAKTAAEAKPGAEQAEVANALAAELTGTVKVKEGDKEREQPKHKVGVRNQVAEPLSIVATDAQVPALAAALSNLETREMARWALDRIPSEAATKALISALEQVGPEFRIGVINALSRRRGSDVQAALLKTTADPDSDVRLAAIEGLANFAEPSNDEPIAATAKNGSPRARARAQRARIRLAETLRNAGKKDAAVAIYKAIIANDADEPQKKAARLALEQIT